MANMTPEEMKKVADLTAKRLVTEQQLNAAGIEYSKIMEDQLRFMTKIGDNVKKLERVRSKDLKILERIRHAEALRGKKSTQNYREAQAEVKKLSEKEQEAILKYKKMRKAERDEEKAARKESAEEARKGINKELEGLKAIDKQKEKLIKEENKLRKAGVGGGKLKRTVGGLGDILGAKGFRPMDWLERGKSADKKLGIGKFFGGVSDKMKAKRVSAVPEGVKPAAAGALENVFGMLSKAGPFLAVAAGITALIKGVVDLEAFMTDLNKTFLKMAGPTVGIRNVPAEMKEFNDSIYDLQRNLKLGVKAKDIQEMFGAMASAGMSLMGAKQKMGSYGNAITEARKLSLELGVSMDKVGDMVVKQMLNMRTNFSDAGTALRAVAYDASKAGITFDKFYGSIENSVMSLSYFGNYLKSTSTLLSGFMQGAQLGFEDAAKAANNMAQAFSGVDYKKGMKAMLVMGEDVSKKMFKELEKNDQDKIEGIKSKIKAYEIEVGENPKDEAAAKELDNLTKELRKAEARQATLTDALKKADTGDLSDLGMQLGRLADRPYEVMEKLYGLAQEYTPGQVQILSNILGVSQETVLHMKENVRETKTAYSEFASGNKDVLKTMLGGNKTLSEDFKALLEERAKGGTGTDLSVTFQENLTKILSKSMSLAEAKKRATKMIMSINKGLDIGLLRPFQGLIDKMEAENATEADLELSDPETAKVLEKGNDLTAKETKTNQTVIDQLINKTTSAKDYFEISKEALKYVGADATNEFLKQLNAHATKMVGFLSLISQDKEQKALEHIDNFLSTPGVAQNGLKRGDIPQLTKNIDSNQKSLEWTLDSFTKKMQETKPDYSAEQAKTDVEKYAAPDYKGDVPKEFTDVVANYKRIKEALDKATKNRKFLEDTFGMFGAGYLVPGEEAKALEPEVPGPQDKEKTSTGMQDASDKMARDATSAGKPPAGETTVGIGTPKTEDFKASKSGLALLDSGDIVANPAGGTMGASGQFTKQLLENLGMDTNKLMGGMLMKGTGGGPASYNINLGGITVQGDVANPMLINQMSQVVTDTVMQAIKKNEYEKSSVN
jgi:hypothetical protein